MTRKLIVAAGIALVMLQSCGDGFKTSEDGLKYKIHTDNGGEKIKLGDYVTLNMIYKTDGDSVLFDSYKYGQPVRLMMAEPQFKGDLFSALELLSQGDSATFYINADSLMKVFGQQRPAFINEGSFLTFDVKIEKVMSEQQMQEEMNAEAAKQADLEKVNIDKYITDNKLTTETTASGLQYMIRKQGSGDKPSVGDTVFVNFEGRLLNGNKFDATQGRPLEFAIGTGRVIKGWDEAFLLLNKGSKATLIVPSAIGYGPNELGGGAIPAHSTLVFDVELVNIKKAKK